MHFYFITRGIQQEIDKFKRDVQSQYFPFKIKDPKTGEEKIIHIQGALRPVQLWEYVLPKECFNEFYCSLQIGKQDGKYDYLNKYIWALRKMLSADKMPEVPEVPRRIIYNKNIHFIPIGVKEDAEYVSEYGFLSEAL